MCLDITIYYITHHPSRLHNHIVSMCFKQHNYLLRYMCLYITIYYITYHSSRLHNHICFKQHNYLHRYMYSQSTYYITYHSSRLHNHTMSISTMQLPTCVQLCTCAWTLRTYNTIHKTTQSHHEHFKQQKVHVLGHYITKHIT